MLYILGLHSRCLSSWPPKLQRAFRAGISWPPFRHSDPAAFWRESTCFRSPGALQSHRCSTECPRWCLARLAARGHRINSDHVRTRFMRISIATANQVHTSCVVHVCVPWKGTIERRIGMDLARTAQSATAASKVRGGFQTALQSPETAVEDGEIRMESLAKQGR